MARLVAPDRGVREVDVRTESHTRRYRPDGGGIYSVDRASDVAQMKAEGFFEASLNPYDKQDANRGFQCSACGFNGWFRKCGKCGHEQVDG